MLARDFLRSNFAELRHLLRFRAYDAGALDRWEELDTLRRPKMTLLENARAEKNRLSAEVGRKKKAGEDAAGEQQRSKSLADQIATLEHELSELDDGFAEIERTLPNIPHESVPDGNDETGNVVVKIWGEPATFAFEPKAH